MRVATELRLGKGAKGKEKVALKLSAPVEGGPTEIKLAFAWALEPAEGRKVRGRVRVRVS